MRPDENKKRHIVVCGKGGGSEQLQADWNQTDNEQPDYIKNKPTIPAAPVQSDWNEADTSSLAYIANKPTIPAAQVNSDWNSASGVAQILNKPTIPTVPAMTTETLTFTLQGGTVKTLNFYVEPNVVPNYFYIQDVSGSDNTLSIAKSDFGAPTIEVFKSTDTVNWTSMGTTDTNITTTIPANSKLYLKATENVWAYDYLNRNYITASGNFNVGGNIMSLLNGDNFENTNFGNIEKQFARLFSGSSTLISASNLVLPNNVTEFCYDGMFYDCSALTTAPALPATTLAQACYVSMFMDCPLLTAAPVLPATTLADNCYEAMFYNCANLNNVTTYAQVVSAENCLNNWLNNVSATGDFYNLGGATYESGESGIPTGWTEHNSL